MGASASSSGGGAGGLWSESIAASRGSRETDRAATFGNPKRAYAFLEQFLKPGPDGQPSRAAGALKNLLAGISEGNPAFAALTNTMNGALDLGPNGLPADVERNILQNVRSSQASRGLIDSSTSAIQEAGALAGGAENIRAQRIAQVEQYLGGIPAGAISAVFPTFNELYQGAQKDQASRTQGYASAGAAGASVYSGTSWSGSGGAGGGSKGGGA